MPSSREPTVVRVNELSDLVEAVPYLLGFTPAESIVAVSLEGPRERMGFSLRCDLVPDDHDDEMAGMLAARLRATDADGALVFVYTDRGSLADDLPRRALVDAVVDALDVPVRDALLVTPDRVWSYLCDDACCPPGGRPRVAGSPGALALSAANVMVGRAVLPDREAVVASVQAVTGAEAARMVAATEAASAASEAIGPWRARDRARALGLAVRDRYAKGAGTVSDDEAARLIVAMHDVRFRDEVLDWALDHEDVVRSLLDDLVRRAQPPMDAPVCTALAWVAYLQGNGLVAASAVERARRTDPDYSLAVLLETALGYQTPPALLREATRASDRR